MNSTLMYHAVMRTFMINFLTPIENREQQMAMNRTTPPAIKKNQKLRSSESPKFTRPWYWFHNRCRLLPWNYSELQPQCDLQEAATCHKTSQKRGGRRERGSMTQSAMATSTGQSAFEKGRRAGQHCAFLGKQTNLSNTIRILLSILV